MREVGFAIVLFTPDDEATSSGQSTQRARQNVVFELGYFSGVLGRGRVCLLRKGDVEIPSDLYGVIYTEMDGADGWKPRLVMELKAAQLDFNANRLPSRGHKPCTSRYDQADTSASFRRAPVALRLPTPGTRQSRQGQRGRFGSD